MKTLICSQNGLGDIFFSLTLAHNLKNHKRAVTIYHTNGTYLQKLSSSFLIQNYPLEEKAIEELLLFDEIFIFYHKDTPYLNKLIELKNEKIKVIYPYPTKHVKNKPFYQDSLIDPTLSFLQNLKNFMLNILKFPSIELKAPLDFTPLTSSSLKKVGLHVCGSHPKKNWPINKFMKLADELEKLGFEPYFITQDRKGFEKNWKFLEKRNYRTPIFDSIFELGAFIKDSALIIGVDSGICHFASCLNVKTLVLGRRKQILNFWQPCWTTTTHLYPPSWIPNLFKFRLRDHYWKSFISEKKVRKKALKLLNFSHL